MHPLSEEQLALYRLTQVDGLGPVRLRALLAQFETATKVVTARHRELQTVPGISLRIIERLKRAFDGPADQAPFEKMVALGVRLVFHDSPDYPTLLRPVDNAPLVMTVKGELLSADETAVAIVGSRRCSSYGEKMARQFATDLARRGFVVVSGLARGIDAVAHRAALDAGGRTIAVLASGLGNIYPPEHEGLAEQIAAQGAVVSEAPIDGAPIGALFPQRNRIISGMSVVTLVIEASLRSGALSTVTHALEQSREVVAVPGRVGDAASEGTNRLIQQGAGLVTGIDDLLDLLSLKGTNVSRGRSKLGSQRSRARAEESLPFEQKPAAAEKPPGPKAPRPKLDGQEAAIWDALDGEAVEMEQLLDRSGITAAQASAALLMLEIKRLVKRLPGNRYQRADGID